jgi:hypothetical protein
MGAIASIKTSSILGSLVRSTSATIGVDVSVAGSPGNLDPDGFNPQGIAQWVDRSNGSQIGYPRLSLLSRSPTKTSRLTRVSLKFIQPVLEQVPPATVFTKAYDLTANLEFLLPERCTLAERTAFFSKVTSLFFVTINASDDVPTDLTGSPLPSAVLALDKPY